MTTTNKKMPDYSEEGFWKKVTKYLKVAGKTVIEKALLLYYAAQSPNTPKWAKGIIYSALAYLIWPADAIPDVVPVAGYTDDLGALALALATVAVYITPKVKKLAEDKMDDLFD